MTSKLLPLVLTPTACHHIKHSLRCRAALWYCSTSNLYYSTTAELSSTAVTVRCICKEHLCSILSGKEAVPTPCWVGFCLRGLKVLRQHLVSVLFSRNDSSSVRSCPLGISKLVTWWAELRQCCGPALRPQQGTGKDRDLTLSLTKVTNN